MTASFDCDDDELYQIEYWFNAQGPVSGGDFVAIGGSFTVHPSMDETDVACRRV